RRPQRELSMATASASRPDFGARPARGRRLKAWLLAVVAASGCAGEEEETAPSASEPPTLELVRPRPRVIRRTVGQPSFVESYERTSIYPKMTAFIEKWNVDIGDKVQRGQVLADLFVPELVEDFGTKKATVRLDRDRVRFAEKQVEVAAAEVEAAR